MSVSKDTIMKELKNLLIHNSIDEITKDDLEGIGIDVSKGTQKFGNIEISNSFFGGLEIKIIDTKKDLEGYILTKNKDLLQKIKNTLNNGSYEINQEELKEYGVFSIDDELVIGNVKLYDQTLSNLISSIFSSVKYYTIELIDEDRNAGGLWKDDLINKKNVL